MTVCNNDAISYVNVQRERNLSKTYLKDGHIDDQLLFSSIPREISTYIGHRFKDLVLYCNYEDNDNCLHAGSK